jgi:hypothetical protein
MSHYDIDYGGLDERTKEARAIQDIIDYLGQERFDYISTAIKQGMVEDMDLDADALRLPLSLAGVQGYPVTAWFNYLKRQVTQ